MLRSSQPLHMTPAFPTPSPGLTPGVLLCTYADHLGCPSCFYQSQADTFLPCLVFPAPAAPQVLQANNNAIESLDGVTNLPRLQELLLCNNRILPSGCLPDSGWDEVPHREGRDSQQLGAPARGNGKGTLAV